MGCLHSKKELRDNNPNLYRVINVDDDGVALWSGQLAISRTELTLYRKHKEPTQWPLKCLRRYGYDADLFTFEAGRRCQTGEGIYAFRCRRAESLFQTLQSYIQIPTSQLDENNQQMDMNMFPMPSITNGPAVAPRNRNSIQSENGGGGGAGTIPLLLQRPNSQNLSPSGTIQSQSNRSQSIDTLNGTFSCGILNEGNYLEPTPSRPSLTTTTTLINGTNNISSSGNMTGTRFHSGLRIGSVTSSSGIVGPLSPSIDPQSPGSPSSITNILEVTTLNPLPISNPGISNLYQEFPLRETNNNFQHSLHGKKLSLDIPPQEPAPSLNNLSIIKSNTLAMSSIVNSSTNQTNNNNNNNINGNSSSAVASINNTTNNNLNKMNNSSNDGDSLLLSTSKSNSTGLDRLKMPSANTIECKTHSTQPQPQLSTTITSLNQTTDISNCESYENSSPMYMNITPGEINNHITPTSTSTTPTTSFNSILGMNRLNSSFSIDPNRLYENLESSDVRPILSSLVNTTTNSNTSQQLTAPLVVNNMPSSSLSALSSSRNQTAPLSSSSTLHRFSKPDIFTKVVQDQIMPNNITNICDKSSEPSTPTIHYIVLDLDQSPANNSVGTGGVGGGGGGGGGGGNSSTGSTAANSSLQQYNHHHHHHHLHSSLQMMNKNAVIPLSGSIVNNGGGINPSTTIQNYNNHNNINNNNNNSTQLMMPSSMSSMSLQLPPESPKKGIMDYAKIDFNKTVALSNSTAPSIDLDSEGSRKTRHSSVAATPPLLSSLSITGKGTGNGTGGSGTGNTAAD